MTGIAEKDFRKEETRLPDGRYLIYYDFPSQTAKGSPAQANVQSHLKREEK